MIIIILQPTQKHLVGEEKIRYNCKKSFAQLFRENRVYEW